MGVENFPETNIVASPREDVKRYLSFSVGGEFKVCDYAQLVFSGGMLAETAARTVISVSCEFEGMSLCLVDMFNKGCYWWESKPACH